MQSIFFHVAMEPKGSPRPRFTRDGRVHMPAGYVKWKEAFAEEAARSMPNASRPWWPEGTPIALRVDAFVQMPKSWSKAKCRENLGRLITQKPDVDNCLKTIMDALTGIAWADDKDVGDAHMSRRWCLDESHIRVQISCEEYPNGEH